MNIFLTACLFFFSFSGLLAVDFEFKVLSKQGQVFVKGGKIKMWEPLLTGTKLSRKNQILLKNDSYLGLIHKTGTTLELSKEGTFKVSSLSKGIRKTKSNFQERFSAYIINELSNEEGLFKTEDYRKNMESIGGVQRATETDETASSKLGLEENTKASKGFDFIIDELGSSNDKLTLISPINSFILENKITFSWENTSNLKKLKLKIVETSNKIVYTQDIETSPINLEISKINLKKGIPYYWSISSGDFKSEETCIYILEASEIDKFKDELDNLNDNLDFEIKALDNIIAAKYYEEKNLMSKVIKHYEMAMLIAPNVFDYKLSYANYLMRKGLYGKAKRILEKQQIPK